MSSSPGGDLYVVANVVVELGAVQHIRPSIVTPFSFVGPVSNEGGVFLTGLCLKSVLPMSTVAAQAGLSRARGQGEQGLQITHFHLRSS